LDTLASSSSLIDSIVSIIGLGGLFFGIYTYMKSQVAKRVEVLFPLIKEFDESKTMNHAKFLLDAHYIIIKEKKEEEEVPEVTGWNKDDLELVLRDHRIEPIGSAEAEIRESFDSLLDFFCKLDYLLEIKQITKQEILYFRYYIDKVKTELAVLNYIKIYKFPLHGYLDEILKE
jgi:hypothetical protein